MSEEIITALFVAGFGFIAFTIGQCFIELILKPVKELKSLIGQIAGAILYHLNYWKRYIEEKEGRRKNNKSNTDNKDKIFSSEGDIFLKLASELVARKKTVWLYCCSAKLFRLPKEADILESRDNLIRLAYSMHYADEFEKKEKFAQEIVRLLKIEKEATVESAAMGIKPLEQ